MRFLLTCSEIGNRYCKAYDIYSLGIILLEIAAWKPIKIFHERHAGESPHAFRRILLDKYVPKIVKEVGLRYQQVVQRCLSGYFDSDIEERATYSHVTLFYKDAVEPMSEIFVG
jgi:hypothetical protein